MQPERKTLIILSPGFAANEADTTCLPSKQQFVLQLLENFPDMQIIVLAFHYPFTRSDYQWKNARIISFNGGNKGGLRRLALWHAVWCKLTAIRKKYRIVGLFSFWCAECALIGKFFGSRNKLPHFTWICGQDALKENAYVRRIRPQPNELVALSDFIADEFQRNHGIRPQFVIPGGINPHLYPEQPAERNIDVLGAGSLIQLKQYDIFIDIVAAAAKTYPGLRSVICGKGPEQQALQSKIEALGMKENILLTGELPYKEVLKAMQRTRVFLHPSSYEGFGMVCQEALYAGAHVISFCKPMKQDIRHWHIVNTKQEMLEKLLELLATASSGHSPVIPYNMRDTAIAVMGLFNIQPLTHPA